MSKNYWKVFFLSTIFLTVVFSGNVIAGPHSLSMNQGNRTSISLKDSKMESTESLDPILEEIRQIEYSEIRYDEENPDYFGFIQGKIPILISAPHGAKHFRKRGSRWKGEDEYTSSLAIELGKLTGAHVIYVKNKTREDPNNDPSSAYKLAVEKTVKQYHIRFLLDIHGSHEGRPYKVDFGILSNESAKGSCPSFKGIIESVFSDFQPRIFNQRFCANDVCTLTFFARQKLGIEAAQVEINARYRILERKPDSSRARAGIEPRFKANPRDVLALVTRLKQLIFEINKELEKTAGRLS